MKSLAPTVVVLAAGGAIAIPLPTAGAQSPGPRTIRLVEHNKGSTFGFVDNPPRAKNRRRPVLSPGDMTAFSTPVFDEANRAQVGRLHVQCVATKGGTEKRADALCTGVYRLRNGQISLVAVLHGNPKVVRGIVTGGNGDFAGAHGTFRSRTTRTGANDTITLLA
jgi:hypothetical protein